MRINLACRFSFIARHWVFWLILITAFAIFLRSLPAWTNAAWGNDFGIYYGLTKEMVESSSLYNPYDGWGGSYQYFPVLYIITSFAHWITGLDVLTLMPKIAPIFGGLTVVILYFLVYELVKKRDVALLSAAFLSVASVHVYQTSHAAPLTMGHFFMLLSLYFFVKYTKNLKFVIPLLFSTILLIMSHHLTTYFYLLSLISIVLFKSFGTDLKDLRREIIYLSACSAMTFLYWAFVATPVFYDFMGRWGPITQWHIIGLFYLFTYGSLLAIHIVKKHVPKLVSLVRRISLKGVEMSHKRALRLFVFSVIALLLLEVVFLFVNFPVSITRTSLLTIVYSLPLVFFTGLSVMGLEYLRFLENKWFFQGWILAIFVSLIYAVISSMGTLYPDRHIEYIMVPMCLTSAYGLFRFFEGRVEKTSRLHISPKLTPVKHWLPLLIALVVICSNGVAVYPVKNTVIGIHDEIISEPCINAVKWMNENLDKNDSVVASDLKLSKLLWAEGFNTTFEWTNETWCAEDWMDCVKDLDHEENHSRVTHVLIDDVMRDNLVGLSLLRNVYMTDKSYEKFVYPPFELIYRNATINNDMYEVRWAEIYEINWTHIEKYYNDYPV